METPETSVSEDVYIDLHEPAVITGGCFVLVALVLSLFLIFQHLRYYTNPAEQKWIVSVLFMVPVYATESIVSLWNSKFSVACDILRNCYEAFALYAFGRYLIACLGGESRVVELLEEQSRKQPLLDGRNEEQGEERKPFWYFFWRPCTIGRDLLIIEKFGLVQYMILKTVCAFLALILELFGVYGDGEFKWNYGYPYIAVVLNFSQMWALYCLVQFYNVTHERLKPIKPLAKFISFKAIVFATWWQGVGIALLCTFRVLPKKGKLQTGLQDFLICIEMAIAAIAHVYVFSVEPYRYVRVTKYREIVSETSTAAVKLEEGGDEKPALIEKAETKIKAPGTSITESVQDIIVGGGHRVVKDVVLTINQAIEPVEKGVTKIQDTFHQRTVESDEGSHEEVEAVESVRQEGGHEEVKALGYRRDDNGAKTVVSLEADTEEESYNGKK